MSKVEAYVCDYCNELRLSAECVGINPTEDLFNKLESYPVIPHPDRADIHLCTTCYNRYCASIAEREVNRKQDEHGYSIKLKELHFSIKSQCVVNFNKKQAKKVQKKVAHK